MVVDPETHHHDPDFNPHGTHHSKLQRMRVITMIILHCSASRSNRRYTFEKCRSDHIKLNGWKDIGYHYYVEQDGTIHEGRDLQTIGAHVHNHNRHSIGICYEGGLNWHGAPADTRTEAQKQSLRALLEKLHERFPKAIILGHRDLSPDLNGDGRITPDEYLKECPCFDTMIEYADLQPKGFWEGKPLYQSG